MKTRSPQRNSRFRVFPRCSSSRTESLLTGSLAHNQNRPSPRDCSRTYLNHRKKGEERKGNREGAKQKRCSSPFAFPLFPFSLFPVPLFPCSPVPLFPC